MPATMTKPDARVRHIEDAHLTLRSDDALPPGVCGRVSGVAMSYDVLDAYRTIFARGCMSVTIARKVSARRVPLLMDHEGETGNHVGVVSSMMELGDTVMMVADLFDTPAGRSALEYAKAVIAANASTGFSVGFYPRRSEYVTVDGVQAERFLEIELREVSITPFPAVPGADVLSARNDAGANDSANESERTDEELLEAAASAALAALPEEARARLVAQYAAATGAGVVPASAPPEATAPPAGSRTASVYDPVRYATPEERHDAIRRSYRTF